eukprot:9216983-Alexandrium_andersonii.AAC.1
MGPTEEHYATPRDYDDIARDPRLRPLHTSGDRNGVYEKVDPDHPASHGNSLLWRPGADDPAPEFKYPGEDDFNWLRPPLLAGE